MRILRNRNTRRFWAATIMIFSIACFVNKFSESNFKANHLSAMPLSNSIAVPIEQDQNEKTVFSQSADPANSISNLPTWKTVRMRVTGYCPCPICCGRFAQGRTANGHIIRQRERFVAADKKYPFGTEVVVPNYNNEKTIKVMDRGGAIKGNCLDLFFDNHATAAKWGVKYLDVKIRVTNENKEWKHANIN